MSSSTVLYDGKFMRPEAVGAKRYQYPFRNNGDRVSAFFEQDYWQRGDLFVPQELSTPHEELADFYLIHETEPVNFGFGELVKFTRTYSRVPQQQVVHSSFLVTMPQPSNTGGKEGPIWLPVSDAGFDSGFVNVPGYLTPNYLYASNSYYSPVKISTSHAASGTNSIIFTVSNHSFDPSKELAMLIQGNVSTFSYGGILAPMTNAYGGWQNVNVNAVQCYFRSATNVPAGNYGFCQYSRGSLGIGSRYVRCKRITDFYLPGITPDIATPDDIPLPQDQSESEAFIDALLNGTGTINVQVGELQRWRDSPIYMITKTTINAEDLV